MTERSGRPVEPVDDSAEGLAARLIGEAVRRGWRIAAAESLTGGMLAATLVSVPGASRAFSGGVVAYDTALKRSMLGVDTGLLRERGPVDGEVARQMARGVRRACTVPRDGAGSEALVPAEIGIATTGVAGPDPDAQTGQPAGTVWVAVSTERGEQALLLEGLTGLDRPAIRAAAVLAALALALRETRAAAS